MPTSFAMFDCITIGQLLEYLSITEYRSDPAKWTSHAIALETLLTEHGFVGALDQMSNLSDDLHVLRVNKKSQSANRISAQSRMEDAARTAQAISTAVQSEALNRILTELQTGDVSKQLRDLFAKNAKLTKPQKHLLEETIRCLECQANRSAIVMAWNFVFESIREWILDKKKSARLSAFNQELVKLTRNGKQKFRPISTYDDFIEQNPSPGEREVLDACEDAKLIVGKPYDSLCHYLRQRNEYAHPNRAVPSISKVNTYIEDLVHLLRAPPFKLT